jgi:tetratricopeptide (TPR) repeat protein
VSAVTTVDRGLSRELADCALTRRSGIITAVRGKLKRLFCVEEGHLVFAASNLIEEQFSEILVRDQLVSVGDLAAAQQVGDETGVKLAKLLVDNHVVDEDAMRQATERHVRDLLFSTLDWSDGESALARGRPDLDGEFTARLLCVQLLLEYARERPASLEEVRTRVGSGSTRLVARADRSALLDHVDSDPATRHLLAGCDGAAAVEDLVESCPGDPETAWRSLYALLLLGLVESGAADDAREKETRSRDEIRAELQRVENLDYYGVLNVVPHATIESIREQYYLLARQYHPDHFRTGPLQDLREQVETYFARVTEAYNTLYDSGLRAAYDVERTAEKQEGVTQDAGHLAQENFRRAQALIAKGRFTDAVTSLENAINLDARNATYRVELGQLLARNPRLRNRAEEQLIEANRVDPSLTAGYLALGDLYRKMNRRDDAVRLYREVLRWEPGEVEATERLRELGAG